MQSAREIKVAIEADGDRVGGLLNEQHPLPVEEGEPAFDYRQHMRHLSSHLDMAVDGAVVSEDAHADQEIRGSRLQEERDEVAGRGYDKLISARYGLESLYKRGGFELAFLSGATPGAPRRLVEQLGQSAKLLRQPVVERRDVKVRGFTVDFDEVADDLESEEKALRSALNRVDAAKKKADGTLLAKRKAADVLRRTLGWVGQTTEGLFRLAGEDELAERIRTSTRRPSRPTEPPEEAAPDSPVPEPPV
jgi:hypothetical protein